ncbi:MAG TPA: A/G-specific adenine glycosylase [Nitrospirota bacterium]|nr:A/G-specific adenine glycosylase [Nitrospirota bacterium]
MTTAVTVKSIKRMSCLLTAMRIQSFQQIIYDYYDAQGRDLPWRKHMNPYRVLVSEIMLQQTQVERVIKKYREFIAAFPDFPTLAKVPNAKLLKVWSGMGYNRRALSLKALAQKVMIEYQGRLPSGPEELIALPGIGKYTAGAVSAFAFNKPVVFIDTNIRRVYIHEFFQDRENIHDDELFPLVEQTMDRLNPRKWFNALMDYGTMLKQKHVNSNRKSIHYVRQGTFENSNRQVRGKILKAIVAQSPLTTAQIVKATGMEPERIQKNLAQLAKEGFIIKTGRSFSIS